MPESDVLALYLRGILLAGDGNVGIISLLFQTASLRQPRFCLNAVRGLHC